MIRDHDSPAARIRRARERLRTMSLDERLAIMVKAKLMAHEQASVALRKHAEPKGLSMTDAELLARARSFDAGPPPTINQFVLDEDDADEHGLSNMTIEWRGETGWAIRDGACCLNKETGEREYEPKPSSRTEEFIAATRFATPGEAFDFLAEWKPKVREEALKSPHMIRWKDQKSKWAEERGEQS